MCTLVPYVMVIVNEPYSMSRNLVGAEIHLTTSTLYARGINLSLIKQKRGTQFLCIQK